MKIVIAPDSYKECLSAKNVAESIAAGIRRVNPAARVVSVPMADGGEGTVASVLAATDATVRTATVSDPIGRPVSAQYAVLGKTAIVEMAEAGGLERLAANERNPMETHTFGTGELIRHAIHEGIRDVVIAVGGSATVDGGMGMADALGYQFYDHNGTRLVPVGKSLARIARVDTVEVSGSVRQTSFRVAADVLGPLLGERGAARMYGPQKGATPEMVAHLERGMARLQQVLIKQEMLNPEFVPGDGAAGGLGMGVRAFLGGRIAHGASLISELVGLETALADADWVVTGEGRTDAQSAEGKICAYVATLAEKYGVKSVLLSGAFSDHAAAVTTHFTHWRAISNPSVPLEVSLKTADANLTKTAAELFRKIAR